MSFNSTPASDIQSAASPSQLPKGLFDFEAPKVESPPLPQIWPFSEPGGCGVGEDGEGGGP